MPRIRASRVALLLAAPLVISACGAFTTTRYTTVARSGSPVEFHEIVPPSATLYASEPIPSPPSPNADEAVAIADRSFASVFRARGDTFRGDARLAQLASWIATRGEAPKDVTLVDGMSRRLGYVGPSPWVLYLHGANIAQADIEARLRHVTESIPSNIPITRYGVGAAHAGPDAFLAVVFASVEVELEPVPKHLARGDTLHLTGKVGERFARVDLAITRPDGVVRTFHNTDREYRGDLTLRDPGVHKVELLGDGTTGPVVLANFPVYVDMAEPEPPHRLRGERLASESSTPVTPALAEQKMLSLLGAARESAHLSPLIEDHELEAIARAHSEDMADHGFFGHVSPTTGSLADRFRRANVVVPFFGENVARGASPEVAHEMLMDSPGHRANMLRSEFTHVGIGAVIRSMPTGERAVLVTLVFAERPAKKGP